MQLARWFWLLKPPRLCTFLSDCDLWSDRCSSLARAFRRVGPRKEHRMHATIRRYEGVDVTRTNEVAITPSRPATAF